MLHTSVLWLDDANLCICVTGESVQVCNTAMLWLDDANLCICVTVESVQVCLTQPCCGWMMLICVYV